MDVDQLYDIPSHVIPHRALSMTCSTAPNLPNIQANRVNQQAEMLANRHNVQAKADEIRGWNDHTECVCKSAAQFKQPFQ